MKISLSKELLTLEPCKSPLNAWVPRFRWCLLTMGLPWMFCPFRTALTVGLEMETIIPSPLTASAYDNTPRKVIGTFKAPHKIGPMETIVEFHVMDITPNYNLLLGRAWLHPKGEIPSSLHQKMKILWIGGIATVLRDGEILAPISGLEEGGSELQMSGFVLWIWLTMGWKTKGMLSTCSLIVAMRWLQWWRTWDSCLVWALEKKEKG